MYIPVTRIFRLLAYSRICHAETNKGKKTHNYTRWRFTCEARGEKTTSRLGTFLENTQTIT